MKPTCVLACLALLGACAAGPADPAAAWRALARADVEAAYRMLSQDHPGASPEAGDAAFRAALEQAHAAARARAERADSFEAHTATLAAFANAMGDRHIISAPLYRSDARTWAGLVIALRGDRFVVDSHATQDGEASLAGAELVSCDGLAAEPLARARLGEFRAVWDIEAQRVQAAPWLLLDDGNPFVLRPETCVFAKDGAEQAVTLAWRPIARTELSPLLRHAYNQGRAGYGVRDFAGGVWIALEGLEAEAPAVVDAVARDAARIRAAPMVVLDLRGNGGGNDIYGRYIADVLFGEARVAATLGAPHAMSCGAVWRASAANEARLRQLRDEITDPATLSYVERALAEVAAARAAGLDFGADIACTRETETGAPAPLQASAGRIVLLTDNACFSSCLSLVDQFRRLGALHVGQTTNANTHYGEIRVETLPSGLAVFSTLQALIASAPLRYGPFAPARAYDGDMADTAALEAWIAALN